MMFVWDRSMRRQQYRVTPKLSKTLPASSPASTLPANSSHLSPTSLPHVKQRTGMIIVKRLLLNSPLDLSAFHKGEKGIISMLRL